jgi:HEAT repeat protein
VTSPEVSGAQFIGAREKLVFARALEDMTRREEAPRARAVRSVAGIRHKLVARALSARLARDPSAKVRKECVKALTALGMEEALPAVERALSDASAAVRLTAVQSVYRLAECVPVVGARRIADSIVRLLSDKHEDVRRRAAACLGWLGQEHLAVHLLPLLRDDSAFVRRTALGALGNLRSRHAAPEVIELLNDPEISVRKKAFDVLRAVTGKQMLDAFPEDEQGHQLLLARWRVWLEREPHRRDG